MVVYLRTLGAGYVSDDLLIQTNVVPAQGGMTGAFFPPHSLETSNYYRPVVLFSWVLEQALGTRLDALFPGWRPTTPGLMHLTNLLTHAATTGFVLLLAERLLRSLPLGRVGALLAAAWFAVHPVHVEAVAWIAGRCDLLSTLFALIATWCAARSVERGGWLGYSAAGVAFLAALLSKETALVLPLLAPIYLLAASRIGVAPVPRRRDWIRLGLAGAVALAAYVSLRLAVSPWLPHAPPEQAPAPASLLGAMAYYVWQSLVPWPHSTYVVAVPGAGPSLGLLAALAVLLGAAARAWAPLRPLLAAAASWWIVPVLPALIYVVRPAGTIVATERAAYWPTVGTALLLGTLLAQWGASPGLRLPLVLLAGTTLLIFGVTCLERVRLWNSNLEFWEATMRDPALARDRGALVLFGDARALAGQWAGAEEVYRRMLQLPGRPPAWLEESGPSRLAGVLLNQASEALSTNRPEIAFAKADEAVRLLEGRELRRAESHEILAKARWARRVAAERLAPRPDPRS
jgi:hypothetical protein